MTHDRRAFAAWGLVSLLFPLLLVARKIWESPARIDSGTADEPHITMPQALTGGIS